MLSGFGIATQIVVTIAEVVSHPDIVWRNANRLLVGYDGFLVLLQIAEVDIAQPGVRESITRL